VVAGVGGEEGVVDEGFGAEEKGGSVYAEGWERKAKTKR
jgi:hypothetical protein